MGQRWPGREFRRGVHDSIAVGNGQRVPDAHFVGGEVGGAQCATGGLHLAPQLHRDFSLVKGPRPLCGKGFGWIGKV